MLMIPCLSVNSLVGRCAPEAWVLAMRGCRLSNIQRMGFGVFASIAILVLV